MKIKMKNGRITFLSTQLALSFQVAHITHNIYNVCSQSSSAIMIATLSAIYKMHLNARAIVRVFNSFRADHYIGRLLTMRISPKLSSETRN